MNRAEPSVNIQVRLKYQDFLKNPVELGPGMHHRSARPHQAADTSAPGQPARPRTLGTIRLRGGRGGSLGPRGHAAGVMPAVAARPAVLVACAASVAPLLPAADRRAAQRQPAYAGPRQRSSPGSNRNRGAGNNHIFFKIDVGFPGQVWSSQVREAKSRCQVKRAGRLLGMRKLCSRATPSPPPLPRHRALGRLGVQPHSSLRFGGNHATEASIHHRAGSARGPETPQPRRRRRPFPLPLNTHPAVVATATPAPGLLTGGNALVATQTNSLMAAAVGSFLSEKTALPHASGAIVSTTLSMSGNPRVYYLE